MTDRRNNSGHYNSGYSNSGYSNSGSYNSGSYNSGYFNSGVDNSGNYNSGMFNTDEPTVRMFNKDTGLKRSDILIPDVCRIKLTEWVPSSEMTDDEKAEHQSHTVTDGYLRTYKYKEAWRRSWDEASSEQRRGVLDLPNFDPEIFLEITGIDVRV